MTTGTVLHIHCHAPESERQHTMTGGCWCHPFTLRLTNGDVIIDHNGAVRPSVLVEPKISLGMDRNTSGLADRSGRLSLPQHRRAPRRAGRGNTR